MRGGDLYGLATSATERLPREQQVRLYREFVDTLATTLPGISVLYARRLYRLDGPHWLQWVTASLARSPDPLGETFGLALAKAFVEELPPATVSAFLDRYTSLLAHITPEELADPDSAFPALRSERAADLLCDWTVPGKWWALVGATVDVSTLRTYFLPKEAARRKLVDALARFAPVSCDACGQQVTDAREGFSGPHGTVCRRCATQPQSSHEVCLACGRAWVDGVACWDCVTNVTVLFGWMM